MSSDGRNVSLVVGVYGAVMSAVIRPADSRGGTGITIGEAGTVRL
jgi:hypothetical protein